MPQDNRILLCVIFVSGLIVYGVSFFPPLTTAGTAGPTGSDHTRFDAVFSHELAYCPPLHDCIDPMKSSSCD